MATIRKGPATGARIDLGTALITQGFGFASRRADGGVVHPAYGVAENQAQARKAGFLAMQFNYVVSTNAAAVHLWSKHGFAIVGRVPEAFRHPTQGLVDIYVMHRPL